MMVGTSLLEDIPHPLQPGIDRRVVADLHVGLEYASAVGDGPSDVGGPLRLREKSGRVQATRRRGRELGGPTIEPFGHLGFVRVDQRGECRHAEVTQPLDPGNFIEAVLDRPLSGRQGPPGQSRPTLCPTPFGHEVGVNIDDRRQPQPLENGRPPQPCGRATRPLARQRSRLFPRSEPRRPVG